MQELTPKQPAVLPLSVLETYPAPDEAAINAQLAQALNSLNKKIVVLDDDPTGVQTVHNISVYTDWSEETFRASFAEESPMFFILTNSRSMTADETRREHQQMARRLTAASEASGKDFILISRSDSTLRGHYPLETETLRCTLEQCSAETGALVHFDGEIIYPFFLEGGRYTIDGVHYVKEGEQLTPAGQTEFAQDKTFGYRASYLPDWCEEKSVGTVSAASVIHISLSELRAGSIDTIAEKLCSARGFQKIVVDSIDYIDVKVFAVAFCKAVAAGKRFLFRSAAAITKVLGGVSDQPLLTRDDLLPQVPAQQGRGLIIVGSHVNKTTRQLEALKHSRFPIAFLEFNQHLVLQEGGLKGEVARVTALAEEQLRAGYTCAVYTRRDRFDLDTDDKEAQLRIATEISAALVDIVAGLAVRPDFVISKGGITSSDIGTKALRVRRATVWGQIRKSVPVWQLGEESKFPGMPYIIFPGNTGTEDDLRIAVETLMG